MPANSQYIFENMDVIMCGNKLTYAINIKIQCNQRQDGFVGNKTESWCCKIWRELESKPQSETIPMDNIILYEVTIYKLKIVVIMTTAL